MELRTTEVTAVRFGVRLTRRVIEADCFLPPTPPGGWTKTDVTVDGGCYVHETHDRRRLRVIVSACIEDDGVPWVHLSLSKRSLLARSDKWFLPTWEELKFAKDSFAGSDIDCIQVLPRRTEYVNIHDVLHLFWRLDGQRACPDFTSGTGSI